jgi:histidine triad (HIT) family protein
MSAPAEDCLFCGIVAGDIPAEVLHRSERSVAFADINPAAPVHVLVVPARHIESAATLEAEDAEELADLLRTAREVARQRGIADSGYRLVFNVGADANNTVAHLHLHVLGGRAMTWPPG